MHSVLEYTTAILPPIAAVQRGLAVPTVLPRDRYVGCLVGLAGALCLHSPRFRTVLGEPLRRLLVQRRSR